MDFENKAFDEGWRAAYKGYTKKDNPYKRFSEKWEKWREGNILSHNDDQYWTSIKKMQRKISKAQLTTVKSYIATIEKLDKTSILCLRGFHKLNNKTKSNLIELSAVISNFINQINEQ